MLYQPLFSALPELAGQGLKQRLDDVLATGEPYRAQALPAWLDRGARDRAVCPATPALGGV